MDLDHAGVRVEHLRAKTDFPFAPLEGVGPNLAGWGVIETCLLLPESVAVMVGPSACLRHSAFMAHARGFTERFHMLCLSELDMTMGNHLGKVEQGIADIAARRDEKVMFLIVGCPDYILGTDFSAGHQPAGGLHGQADHPRGHGPHHHRAQGVALHLGLHLVLRLPQA